MIGDFWLGPMHALMLFIGVLPLRRRHPGAPPATKGCAGA